MKVVLDYDGQLLYQEEFLDKQQCELLISHIMHEVNLTSEHLTMFGKQIVMERKVAWISNPTTIYSYSGKANDPQPWTKELLRLKEKIESFTSHRFNSCLINYYPDGKSGMGYHQDNEKELGTNPIIASISLGCERIFQFKHIRNSFEKREIKLSTGSLLVMKGEFQTNWKHALKKDAKQIEPRINLTFRYIIEK